MPHGAAAFWLALFYLVCLGLVETYLAAARPLRFDIDAVQSDGWYGVLVLLAAFVVARSLQRPVLVWQIAALYLSADLYLYGVGSLAAYGLRAAGLDTPGVYWWLFGVLMLWSLLAAERLLAALAGTDDRQQRVGLALFLVLATGLPSLVLNYGEYWRTDYYALWQAQQRDEPPALDAEALLIGQHGLVADALGALAPQRPGELDVYFVGVAGDGSQDVFLRELHLARNHLATRFGASLRTVLLINNRATVGETPLATAATLQMVLNGIAERMDPDQDLLFLYLTSHGSEDHELVIRLGDLPLREVSAGTLGRILAQSDIPFRVVAVSACYSGGFVEHLADERTLVLTAARKDRNSFGCGDDEEMTYFGRALFEYALPVAGSLGQAFEIARREVTAWEVRDGYTPSEPQWAGAAEVETRFGEWFASWPPAAAP